MTRLRPRLLVTAFAASTFAVSGCAAPSSDVDTTETSAGSAMIFTVGELAAYVDNAKVR